MSTHDYNIANASGASVRSDINNALAAILSNNSNGSSPSTTVAYSIWADTSAAKLKIRNSANDAWVELINLDGTIARDISLTGDLTLTDKIIHSGDTNTAIRFPAADTFTVETAGSERFRVDSSGNCAIGTTSPDANFSLVSDSTSASNFAITINNSTPTVLFSIKDDGEMSTGTASESPYNKGTSNSANLFVTSAGVLKRSTSSERYKKDITDATWGLADVLKLRPVTFKSNATGADADDKTYAGFTAEAIHALGLTEFVQYNDSNEPDALNYGNMVALMAKAIQELSVKVTALEAE